MGGLFEKRQRRLMKRNLLQECYALRATYMREVAYWSREARNRLGEKKARDRAHHFRKEITKINRQIEGLEKKK